MIRELHRCQVHDPGRGSFYVNARPVSNGGKVKHLHGRVVYKGSQYANGRGGYELHPQGHEFVVLDGAVT